MNLSGATRIHRPRSACHRRRDLLAIPPVAELVAFRKPAVPGRSGAVLHDRIAKRRNMWWFRGEAMVEGDLVCEAEVSAMVVCE